MIRMLHKKRNGKFPLFYLYIVQLRYPKKSEKMGQNYERGGGEIGNFVLFFLLLLRIPYLESSHRMGVPGLGEQFIRTIEFSLDFSSERKYIALPNLDSSSVEKSRRKRLKKEKSLEMLIVCLIHTYPLVKKTDFLFSPICHKKHYNFGQIC